MKKLIAILLSAIMVLGLAACGPTQTGIDTENLEVHEEVTLLCTRTSSKLFR